MKFVKCNRCKKLGVLEGENPASCPICGEKLRETIFRIVLHKNLDFIIVEKDNVSSILTPELRTKYHWEE